MPWTVRRANLLIEGLDLRETTGARLRIGDVVLQVSCETEPCYRMEEAVPGLKAALEPGWRGGVCCRVVKGGAITPGVAVALEPATQDQV